MVDVHGELEAFLTRGRAEASAHGEEYARLWHELTAATIAGKQLRPRLMLVTYRAYGGTDHQVADRVAASLELLHTALLLHDDVIDGDLVRRGVPNVSGAFAARAAARGAGAVRQGTYGLAAGVLAGDLALAGAIRGMALCGAGPDTTALLLDLLDHAVRVSAAGELADVALSLGGSPSPVTLTDVLSMEEQKTAVYSFQLPLQTGAVLAGVPRGTWEPLAEVGRLAGVGYQLVDDLLGVFGDERVTGKSTLGDLREGKETPLVAYARSTPAWSEIAQHLGDPTIDQARAARVRTLLADCGSRAFVEQLADDHLHRSLRVARELGLPSSVLVELTELTELGQRVLRSAA